MTHDCSVCGETMTTYQKTEFDGSKSIGYKCMNSECSRTHTNTRLR